MIHITDPYKCCGCGACVSICPRQCIVLKKDDTEGFLYPEVDSSLCCHCDACERVCPMLNDNASLKPLYVIACRNEDKDVRISSSSGGIFSSLAEHIISKGGVVFGVRFSDDFGKAIFCEISNTSDISLLRGSKYMQAETTNIYTLVRERLHQERLVLFSGTPCQIRALRLYLGQDAHSSLLYCVDIICHGVPSSEVWRRYLHNVIGNQIPSHVSFRDKTTGWKNFSMVIKTPTEAYSCVHRDDLYMQSFLRNVNLRPSCYNCQTKNGRSGADLTIGDFWGIPSGTDDDSGVSQVLVMTNHGKLLLNDVHIYAHTYPICIVQKYNPAYFSSVAEPTRRRYFWKYYHTNLVKAVKCSTEHTFLFSRLKHMIKTILWHKH